MGEALEATNAAGMPTTILVVEDEVLVRFVICDALRAQGFKVVEAVSAVEADALVREGLAVDLVFTDVRMPGAFDGLELARRLKAQKPDLPVLVTSGHLDGSVVSWATGFLPKPYIAQDAVTRISALIPRTTR